MPHRVSVLCPQLALETRDQRLGLAAALLHHTLIYELLIDHGVVAIGEPHLRLYQDNQGKLIDQRHPLRGVHQERLFESHRLHELLTFTLDLRPQLGGSRGGLRGERFDSQRLADLEAPAGVPLSVVIEGCIVRWLRARGFALPERPLPAFDVREFLLAARHLRTRLNAYNGNPETALDELRLQPRALAPTVRRALMMAWGQAHPEFILQEIPDDLWAAREAAMVELSAGIRKRESLTVFVDKAPQWGRARLALFGASLPLDEQVRHAAMAATLLPGDPTALANYAVCLLNVRRADEAYRIAQRATALHPLDLRAHLTALNAVRVIGRPEQAFAEARLRQAQLEREVETGALPADSPELALTRLVTSTVSLDVGRRAEAIEIRKAALELTGNIPGWEREAALLEHWQADPDIIARSYARAGHHRGRPDAVIEGFRCATPERGTDLAKLLAALLDCGRDGLAAFVYAQHRHQRLGRHAEARLAGARTLMLNGYLESAIEQIQIVQLRLPQAGHHVAVNTLLRLGSALPAGQWVASIAKRLKAGARHLAKMVARDAADFVPLLDRDTIVLEALGLSRNPTTVPYNAAWMAPLRAILADNPVWSKSADAIDGLLDSSATWPGPPLALHDALVQRWPSIVGQVSAERGKVWVYTLGASLSRYLAACTAPPSPIAGAYRYIASAAVSALSQLRYEVPRDTLEPLLRTLAMARQATRTDEWLWDTWLLRVEQALDLTGRVGHPSQLTRGLAPLDSVLRGDLEVAFELRLADAYSADPTLAPAACDLYMRGLRAVGGSVSPRLSKVIPADKPTQHHLDRLWTAAAAAPGHAAPRLALAHALFATGRGDLGVHWLTLAARLMLPQERAAKLAPLRQAFVAATTVPFDAAAASEAGLQDFESGNFRRAIPALAWAAANHPQDQSAQSALGEAYARMGEPVDAMDAFCRADAKHGPHWSAEALLESGQNVAAKAAFEVASLGYSSGAEWLEGGRALHELGAHRASINAYEAAENLGAEFYVNDLWQLAMSWGYLGDTDESEIVARQLIAMAAGDPSAGVAGWTLLAQVELTRGSEGGALRALDKVPQLDPTAVVTLDELLPIEPIETESGQAMEWFEQIRSGDMENVDISRVEVGQWQLVRAQLVAARHRHGGALCKPVTSARIEAGEGFELVDVVLGETQGTTDVQAALCRVIALESRQAASYGLSPPPPAVDVAAIGNFQHSWMAALAAKGD